MSITTRLGKKKKVNSIKRISTDEGVTNLAKLRYSYLCHLYIYLIFYLFSRIEDIKYIFENMQMSFI